MNNITHVYPQIDVFLNRAPKGKYFPFLARIQTDLDPRQVYTQLRKTSRGESFLLDSGRYSPVTGRYSFVLVNPFMTFESKGKTQRIRRGEKEVIRHNNPFNALREMFEEFRFTTPADLPPFLGGGVGLLSYELKDQIERFQSDVEDPYGIQTTAI